MRILVTGATGLLGTDLCRLLGRDHEVLGWSRRLRSPLRDPSVPMEQVDITEGQRVLSRLTRWAPAVVVHTAAMTDVDACERDPDSAFRFNAEGTKGVASACGSVGAFLMAVSTDYVFDGTADRPYREEDLPHPINVYGRSKLEGEKFVLNRLPRALVIRVSGLFGSSRPNFVLTAVQHLRAGQEVPVVTDQLNSPSYTADVAEGIGHLVGQFAKDPRMAQPQGVLNGVVHLANSGGASRLQVAEVLAATLGAPTSLIRRTTWADLNRPARRPARSELACQRFARQVGAPLRSWEEALRAFLIHE